MKKYKGLTLMELTIVLAIIAIIAAILIPVFLLTTDRARLRGDIQSARVIQQAMDTYRIERGRPVADGSSDVDEILTGLVEAGYIRRRNRTIQTTGAAWHNHPVYGIMVDISGSPPDIHSAYSSLSEDEQFYVHGGRAVGGG